MMLNNWEISVGLVCPLVAGNRHKPDRYPRHVISEVREILKDITSRHCDANILYIKKKFRDSSDIEMDDDNLESMIKTQLYKTQKLSSSDSKKLNKIIMSMPKSTPMAIAKEASKVFGAEVSSRTISSRRNRLKNLA